MKKRAVFRIKTRQARTVPITRRVGRHFSFNVKLEAKDLRRQLQVLQVKGGNLRHLYYKVGPQLMSYTTSSERLRAIKKFLPLPVQNTEHYQGAGLISALDVLGVWRSRIPVLARQGTNPVDKFGRPITAWEVPNKDMSSIIRYLGAGLKLKDSGGVDFSLAMSTGRCTNSQIRRFRSTSKKANSRRRLSNVTYRALESFTKSVLSPGSQRGIAGQGIYGQLHSAGNSRRVIKFRKGSALRSAQRLAALARRGGVAGAFRAVNACDVRTLPYSLSSMVNKTQHVWIRPRYAGIKRFSQRLHRTTVPIRSSQYGILPWTPVDISKCTRPNKYMPNWWLELKLNNLLDSSSARILNLQNNISILQHRKSISSVGVRPKLLSLITRPRPTWLRSNGPRMKRKIPTTITSYDFRAGNSYFVKSGLRHQHPNLVRRPLGSILLSSFMAMHAKKAVSSGGLYKRHPRWTSKLTRTKVSASRQWAARHDFHIYGRRHFVRPAIYRTKTWLRNVGSSY